MWTHEAFIETTALRSVLKHVFMATQYAKKKIDKRLRAALSQTLRFGGIKRDDYTRS